MEKTENIGKLLSIIHRHSHMFFQKAFENEEIGGGQIFFLLTLINNSGINQERLAAELSIDKGTTARAVKKLENTGFLIRKVDVDDRRAYKLYPTDKARNFYKEFLDKASEWEKVLTQGLNPEESTALRDVLSKVIENVQGYRKLHKQ